MQEVKGDYGAWAMVAGAAEGIGEGFCHVLAEKGFNLILVDNNEPAMAYVATKIRQKHRVETMELTLDLASAEASMECMKVVTSTDCRLLIYVAAYSRVCPFNELEPAELDQFLSINTRTLLHLVHGFSNRLIAESKTGGILLVSSLAGLIGPSWVATYAATKSFSIRLTEALYQELKDHDIDITVCCMGTVSTPTYWKGKPSFEKMKPPIMQPAEAAGYAISQLGVKPICIPGITNRLQYFFLMNLIPRRLASRLVNNAMEKMYGKKSVTGDA